MTILLTNDDGITAKGLETLAKAAVKLGKVYIVAPNSQCSAMSHRILIEKPLTLREVDYPVGVEKAYSLEGTPADCVKTALDCVLPEKPDFVFSGMNFGYNMAFDIGYSGTVGAAMEAVINGVPAISFSNEAVDNHQVADHYLPQIMQELMESKLEKNEMWNVNFPGCDLKECKGILRDRFIAPMQVYEDHYVWEKDEEGNTTLRLHGNRVDQSLVPKGSDVDAVWNNYVSIGKVVNNLL